MSHNVSEMSQKYTAVSEVCETDDSSVHYVQACDVRVRIRHVKTHA